MPKALNPDLDVKQLINLAYFAIGAMAAVDAAILTDHHIFNEWFFGAAAVFLAALVVSSALSASKIRARRLFETDYILPISVGFSLRAVALLLPLCCLLTAFYYLHSIFETKTFISRLEQLDKEHRAAEVQAVAANWMSKHQDNGYCWYKLAGFYQSKGQLSLALDAANEHIRLHSSESCARTQRNEILAALTHKPISRLRKRGYLDATSIAILMPTLVFLALVIAAANKKRLFPWQKNSPA